jgi:hypothetical protein
MQRRRFILSGLNSAGALALATPLLASGATPGTDALKVQSLLAAQQWLDAMEKANTARTTGKWPLNSVLEHLSQSIEMSMDGFPLPKSALFQSTTGAAAFAFFGWRGKMSHSLEEPIPGAAALSPPGDWHPAAQRLRAAIARFEAHKGALKPHFAYGALTHTEFARAHVFHIANHQDEIVAA